MKRLGEVIGLPVMCGGRRLGFVSGLCLTPDVRDVLGFNVQRAFRVGAFVPERGIRHLGDRAVEIDETPQQRARESVRFAPVCDAQGLRLGVITDAAIDERTLRVMALEISFGPLDDLLGGRRWVHRFTAQTDRIYLPDGKGGDHHEAFDDWGLGGGQHAGHGAGRGHDDDAARQEDEARD